LTVLSVTFVGPSTLAETGLSLRVESERLSGVRRAGPRWADEASPANAL